MKISFGVNKEHFTIGVVKIRRITETKKKTDFGNLSKNQSAPLHFIERV